MSSPIEATSRRSRQARGAARAACIPRGTRRSSCSRHAVALAPRASSPPPPLPPPLISRRRRRRARGLELPWAIPCHAPRPTAQGWRALGAGSLRSVHGGVHVRSRSRHICGLVGAVVLRWGGWLVAVDRWGAAGFMRSTVKFRVACNRQLARERHSLNVYFLSIFC